MRTNNGLISSLLKVFAMFGLRLLGDKEKMDVIAIRCINCKIETVLFKKIQHLKKLSLNLCQMQYCIIWASIYLKLHRSMFEYFITNKIIDIYNLMCSLVAHDKIQPAYEDN